MGDLDDLKATFEQANKEQPDIDVQSDPRCPFRSLPLYHRGRPYRSR